MFRRNASPSAKQPLRSAVVIKAGKLQNPTIPSTSSRENAAAYAAKKSSTDLRVMPRPYLAGMSVAAPRPRPRKRSQQFCGDVEAPPGFEPGNEGFAVPCLTNLATV